MIVKTNTKAKVGSTKQFADINFVKPQTILKRHCETGSYFGVVPIQKLPNGRLIWPLDREAAE